jgi:competence protein ComEC
MALEIFVPNTGQGDCTFITFPNGKNMLVDINRTDVDVDIIEFLRKKIPKKKHEDIDKTCRRLNYFVNTHPHEDHLKGVGDLDTDEFYIDQIWESGHRLYVPADQKDKYKHYYDFLALVSKLSKRNAVTKLRAGRAPKTYIGSTAVYVFAPSSYIVDSKSREEIHNQCAVLRIEYTGNSILLTGDSYRDSWENRIVPQYSDDKVENGKRLENLLKSTVLHAAHHVSKYFFVKSNDDDDKYKRAMDKIKPSFTVISVGVGNKHGHPHQIAMNIYREKTKYGRVWTTKDEKSMYFALKNDGKVEYKKGLDYDDLTSIKHEAESFDSAIRKTAATLSFGIREDIEMELPNRPPKVKREGYR